MVKDLNDPTNVDSVPAMLTPGEFVLNKEATTMFGPLIEQMNNAGLQQRVAENKNMGGYAVAKSTGYNTGGLVGFLKEKEGYKNEAYQDSAGVWTIGYGRTTNPDGSPIKPGQTTTREKEEGWLDQRAGEERAAIDAYAEQHGYDWSDQQKDALASFRYNGGPGMLDMLTDGGSRSNAEIEAKIPEYNKVTNPQTGEKEFVQGLQNRRDAELALWSGNKEVPRQEAPPQTQVADAVPAEEVPPTEGNFLSDGLTDLATAYFNQQAPQVPVPQVMTMAPQQPQYIESVARKKPVQSFNRGGFALSEEERRRRALLAAQQSQNKPMNFKQAAEVKAQQRVPPMQRPPRSAMSLAPLPPTPATRPDSAGNTAKRINNQLEFMQSPAKEVPPQIVDAPPVPGSDEALLQSSSQQVEQQESNQGRRRKEAGGPAVDHPGTTSYTGGGRNVPRVEASGPAQPEQLGDDYTTSYTGGGRNVPRKEAGGPKPAGLQAPAREKPPTLDKKSDAQLMDTSVKVNEALKTVANEEPIPDVDTNKVIAAGQEAAKDPSKIQQAGKALTNVFGDLINPQELARMAVVFAGAMVTGASPGQALAISGQMYLQRLDAHANQFNQLATSGKYTMPSLRKYKETGDITTLVPVGATPERTGKFVTEYDSKGKPVKLEEVKIGKSTYLQDEQGNIRSGFEFKTDASEVRGTKEYRTRVKESTGQISKQLEEMRETFDTFKTDDGEGSKTDILPSTSSQKIAEWAIDNGVSPDELGGLVESAYHDALNDRRQDGSRARNLVPYLQQLVIRQQVGGNADVFKAKSGEGYVNAQKLQVLNAGVAATLKRMGMEGGISDLSNMFYTEALKDWNGLDEGTQKQWERKALKDESGFYLFAQNMLLKGGI